MDVVANNIANSNTTAFKREGIEFDTYLSHGNPQQALSFVVDKATYRDAATGPIQPTGNDLDLAIQGQGYFAVQTKDGKTAYTRNGSFQLNAAGEMVTHTGEKVLNDGGQAITFPDTTTQINISSDGFVTARVDNNVNLAELGKLPVFKFDNEQELKSQGNGLYTTRQTAAISQNSSVIQGSIEQSNVSPVTEMTEMIRIMRTYEQTSNLIGQENQRQDDAINKLSKTTA